MSTPEGFAAAVKSKRGLLSGAIISFVAALFCIGINILELGQASDWEWSLIGRFFFDAEVIEFSGRKAGRAEMLRYVWVWGPVILIPLGIILLVAHFMTRKNAGAKLFEEYRSRGFVGIQRQSGLVIQSGKTQMKLALIGNAAAPEGYVDNHAAQYGNYLASLDKKTLKQESATAARVGALKGVSAAQVNPNLPADMVIAPVVGKGDLVAVIPPASGVTPVKVLQIKTP